MKNYGFNPSKELKDQSKKDFVFGGVADNLKGLAEDISENQELITYLPTGEVQQGRGDMMDCATRGPTNILETKLNYWLKSKNMSVDNAQWLNDNGFIDTNGNISISDAFTAILSGTTANGNSLKAPLDALRKYGFIPKKVLPLDPQMTQAQYLAKKRITQPMRDLGLEAIKRFPINYIRYNSEDFPNLLKYDMVDVAGYAWPSPVNGIYPRVNLGYNHCFVCIPKTDQYTIFDNYLDFDGDFIKRLATNYDLYETGYRMIINENDFSFELTTDMVRYIYMLREDVRDEFPARNEFYSINDPTRKYTIYDWCRRNGYKENPEVFINNNLDQSRLQVAQEIKDQAKIIPDEKELKKKFISELIINLLKWFKSLFL